jgi:hypothetical protein
VCAHSRGGCNALHTACMLRCRYNLRTRHACCDVVTTCAHSMHAATLLQPAKIENRAPLATRHTSFKAQRSNSDAPHLGTRSTITQPAVQSSDQRYSWRQAGRVPKNARTSASKKGSPVIQTHHSVSYPAHPTRSADDAHARRCKEHDSVETWLLATSQVVTRPPAAASCAGAGPAQCCTAPRPLPHEN